jgi:hypothetical protein
MIMAVTMPLAGRFNVSLYELAEAALCFGSNRRPCLATNRIVVVTMPVSVAVATMAVTGVMVLRMRNP